MTPNSSQKKRKRLEKKRPKEEEEEEEEEDLQDIDNEVSRPMDEKQGSTSRRK